MKIPDKKDDIKKFALDVIEVCQHSQGQRQARCRQLRQWIETGRASGEKSLHNRLYSHNDRLASYLFSPADLRFTIDYENHYEKELLLKAELVARVLSREWERNNIDITFGDGVKVALDYGACIIKALVSKESTDDGDQRPSQIRSRLVMPWHFGVYDENVTSMQDQEAVCETAFLTLPQAWRRIAHLPDAEKLFEKIKSSAMSNNGSDGLDSFFHQILSTSQLQTSLQNTTSPIPGGIVSLSNSPSDVVVDAERGAPIIQMKELWVWNEDEDDWVTIQMFDPDILVAPLYKKSNLFCPGSIPYGLIQPNSTPGYFWGRAEITDLTETQGLLTEWLDDTRRLMGVQFDKLIAFTGDNQITDERYDQFRSAGYFDLAPGSSVSDLTPKLPEKTIEMLNMLIHFMDDASGFGNILSGQGEAGVRAGSHANTLLKTASPRLRDRAIAVERQCSSFAEAILDAMQAKSDKIYWPNPHSKEEEDFLLGDLPDDRRVSIDSHSSSPIYEDDHKEMVGFLLKNQIIDGESALDLLSVPMRDLLKDRYKAMQQQKQEMVKEHPELLTKGKHK